VRYLVQKRGKLSNSVHNVPKETDGQVARLKLNSMGIRIDNLIDEQHHYLSSWQEGSI